MRMRDHHRPSTLSSMMQRPTGIAARPEMGVARYQSSVTGCDEAKCWKGRRWAVMVLETEIYRGNGAVEQLSLTDRVARPVMPVRAVPFASGSRLGRGRWMNGWMDG